jgi:dihydrofolate reductase
MQAAQNSPPAARSSGQVPLALIAAVAANGCIGERNRLPWRLPEDLRRFRALTTGHAVIMGRKTWESLGGPLPGRQNIVVTRNPDYAAAGAEVATTLDEALARVRMPAPAFCIGGGELYRIALPRACLLYLTEIEREFSGDASFPAFDHAAWRETGRERRSCEGPDGFAYCFVTRERRDAQAPGTAAA